MGVFSRFVRLCLGRATSTPALRPVLAVGFVVASFSAGWVFVGIWAVDELGATSKELGVSFLIAAVLSMFGGYLGGHASDDVGRRPLIFVGWGFLAATFLAYAFVGDHNILSDSV